MISNWDKKFIELSKHVATWSKDVSKVGAVIVKDNIVLSMGYNGFPRGANDNDPSRVIRDIKLIFTVHAEENAILNAARNGIALEGSTMYLQWFPCIKCANHLINAGIKRLVCRHYDPTDTKRIVDYGFDCSEEILNECNIQIDYYE